MDQFYQEENKAKITIKRQHKNTLVTPRSIFVYQGELLNLLRPVCVQLCRVSALHDDVI